MYLVSVAMQWLIADMLPKSDKRTILDKLISLTSISILALLGVATCVKVITDIELVPTSSARQFDVICSLAITCMYVVCTAALLVPRLASYRRSDCQNSPFPGTVPAQLKNDAEFKPLYTEEIGSVGIEQSKIPTQAPAAS